MGGLHGGDAGHGSKPECQQHLDGANEWRRGSSIDAERARFVAGVVAGWKHACVSLFTRRRFASVFAFDGWGRGARPDETLDRRGHREVVAGWKDDCIYVFGLSGLQRRRMQQQARRGKREEQGEGTRGGEVALSALESV